jgi:phage tail sheath protein FI
MASTLKTPGVYIEEISKFPPSVAQVETAIPAFIGYTEKATKEQENDLILAPTRITSLLEYETYFGGADAETDFTVDITEVAENNDITSNIVVNLPGNNDWSPYKMYYAMQMYFANGGGPCYIISVHTYSQANGLVAFNTLQQALHVLLLEDEPTLILFPDANRLDSASNFYELYNSALAQCADLKDRFTIIDTYTNNAGVEITDPNGIRNRISSDAELKKYGAAYFPYLKTILNYSINSQAVTIIHTVIESPASNIQFSINQALNNVVELEGQFASVILSISAAATAIENATSDALAIALVPDLVDALNVAIQLIKNTSNQATLIATSARNMAALTNVLTQRTAVQSAATTLNTNITDHLINTVLDFEGKKTELSTATTQEELDDIHNDANTKINDVNVQANIIDFINSTLVGAVSVIVNHNHATTFGILNTRTLADAETLDNGLYNKILAEIRKVKVELPPSSSMAGVYARVDSDRGVWKAPANVGLRYVEEPTMKISAVLNGSLNIDTTAGKSINAIRSFTGKGTMVWGARTLAGNDNEWRYVSVRRFFNMVEESVKKASENFVFEANDANTWVKIRAMIENFLTNQWKAGAMAGAKADDAFYVRVGLNQTMTAEEIFNGIMNIEIGMAVVRPAEFIVLKFSHKMQES